MGHSIDQEANGTDHEYFLASGTYDPRFANTVSGGSYCRYHSSTSYPSRVEHQQHISSNSSVISSNEINGPTSAPIPQGDANALYCGPDGYIPTPGGSVSAFVRTPSEFANDFLEQYPCLAPHSTILAPPSDLLWSLRDQESAASDLQIQYYDSSTSNSANGAEPCAQEDQKPRCKVRGCGRTFTRQSDVKRHCAEQHDPSQNSYSCGCCRDKKEAPSFKRMEKLVNHKIKFHGHARGSMIRSCEEATCQGESTTHRLLFCTEECFLYHKSQVHGISASEKFVQDHETSNLEATASVSRPRASNTKQNDQTRDQSLLSSAKRNHETRQKTGAKRARMEQHPGEQTDTHQVTNISSASQSALDFLTSPRIDFPREIEDAPTELLVRNVWPSDFFRLHKFIHAVERDIDLTTSVKSEKPPISFNLPQRSIKLRGVEKVIGPFKRFLEGILENQQCPKPSQAGRVTYKDLVCLRTRFRPVPTRHEEDGPKLFTLRSKEDSDLLSTWHEIVVPALPEILDKAIGDNYSASLVRKGLSEQSCRAVIQIQIPKKPSQAVCKDIRSQILRHIDESLTRYHMDVEFSTGSLALLAGDELEVEVSESDTETTTPEDYPYYKRYWSRPGMGASIGLLCTKKVSATLGCYIHVDGDLFLLTVKHFITKSYKRLIKGTTDVKTLVSPALVEVDEMKVTLDQFIRDINSEITIEWKKNHGEGDSPPSDFQSPSDEIRDLLELIAVARKDRAQLEEDVDHFRLGSIVHSSDPTKRIPASIGASPPSKPGIQEGHHMDWALCSVSEEREGANQHRYQFDADTGKVDYCAGDIEELGAGQPCLDTCQVEPNEHVHFVGQTTGRQRAEIHAAKMLVSCEKIKTLEWILIPPEEEQKNPKRYGGASGASIIRDRDNKLVGHLWACTKEGLLVFTPINHVFQNIRQQLEATVVRLAPAQRSRRSPPPPLSLREDVNEVEEICRDKDEESPKRRTYRISSMQLPNSRPKPQDPPLVPKPQASTIALPSPKMTVAAPMVTFRAKETLQPTPALSVSSPSKQSVSPIPRNPWPKQSFLTSLWAAEADKENKYSLGFIVTDLYAKQPAFLHHQQPMLQRSSNTWPTKKPRLLKQRAVTVN